MKFCNDNGRMVVIVLFIVLFSHSVYGYSIPNSNQPDAIQLSKCRSSTSIVSIAVAPDDQTVLTNWNDGKARLWDMKTGKPIRDFVHETGTAPFPYTQVTFSPLGNIIATGGEYQATLWDVQTGAKIHSFLRDIDDSPFGTQVSFSSDGSWLFTSGYDGASLWDVKTGKKLRTFPGLQARDASQYGHLSADDKYVLTTDKFQVNIWDAVTGKKLHTFEENWYGMFTLDTKFILTWRMDGNSDYGGKLVLWDIKTFQEKGVFQTSSSYLKFSPDSRYFIESGNPVRLWEIATGKMLVSIRYGYIAGFLPDNHHLILPYSNSNASSGTDNTLQIWDLNTQVTTKQIPVSESEIFNSELTHDGKYIVIAKYGGELDLLSIEKQEQLFQFC